MASHNNISEANPYNKLCRIIKTDTADIIVFLPYQLFKPIITSAFGPETPTNQISTDYLQNINPLPS